MQAWLTDIIAIYQDPWFLKFPVATLAISIGAFLFWALPWTLVAWIDPPALRKYKIQSKDFEVARYFWPSIGRTFWNALILLGILTLVWPVLRHSPIHDGQLPAWYWILVQIVFFVLLDDFIYYWMHRYFHENKWLLKNVHAIHHRIHNTTAINGNYFHWLEFVLTATVALIPPTIIGAHIYVVWGWLIFRQFEASDGHCGYDIPWNPAHWLPVYEGPVYHDFHHKRFHGNYSGFLPYLDGVMGGTYVKEYLEYRALRRDGLQPQEINQALADRPRR